MVELVLLWVIMNSTGQYLEAIITSLHTQENHHVQIHI